MDGIWVDLGPPGGDVDGRAVGSVEGGIGRRSQDIKCGQRLSIGEVRRMHAERGGYCGQC